MIDGELEILHVAIMVLETVGDFSQLVVHIGHGVFERGDRLRSSDAGHDILTLGVGEKLAVHDGGAGGRVAGERDTGPRILAAVAEHHGLNIDCGVDIFIDAVQSPIVDGPPIGPRVEHRRDRQP